MKKPHINKHSVLHLTHEGIVYAIPYTIAQKYVVENPSEKMIADSVPADKIFSTLVEQSTKAGALLKGLRIREGLSQEKFAKKINVTQANLSKMENGKRVIGRAVAKRIEKAFEVDYRYFLE